MPGMPVYGYAVAGGAYCKQQRETARALLLQTPGSDSGFQARMPAKRERTGIHRFYRNGRGQAENQNVPALVSVTGGVKMGGYNDIQVLEALREIARELKKIREALEKEGKERE